MNTNFEIGSAKADITIFKENTGMLGYGVWHNIIKGVATPLYARAFVIRRNGRKVAFVVVEICFCTVFLKKGVLKVLQEMYPHLGYTEDNVMITAQHTHSAPGGFTQHFLYNMVQPGFQQDVYERFRDGIVQSIVDADSNAVPANIKSAKGSFAPEVEIAFNRSMPSYNRNPEVNPKLKPEESHLAVDREMRLLRFDDAGGNPVGAINWFALHTTSISNDNNKICSDNKGYAAQYMEHQLNQSSNPDDHRIIAGFAQGNAGDVTPNYIWDRKKKWTRGQFEDDFESAKHQGRIQCDKAMELFAQAFENGQVLEGEIDYCMMYADMSKVECSPAFTNGEEGCRTSPPSLGISFLEGTREGPGSPKLVGNLLRAVFPLVKAYELWVTRFWKTKAQMDALRLKYKTQSPKTIIIEAGEGRIMTARYVERLIVPGFVDPYVKAFKMLGRGGITKQKPWISQVLPLQIISIGHMAFVAVPSEITTMAGKRLRETMEKALRPKGITEVWLAPYSNAYAGYITTREEYQEQAYEGGHTLFGKWTLAAYQTKFEALANEMVREQDPNKRNRGEEPIMFPEEELWRGFKDKKVGV